MREVKIRKLTDQLEKGYPAALPGIRKFLERASQGDAYERHVIYGETRSASLLGMDILQDTDVERLERQILSFQGKVPVKKYSTTERPGRGRKS